MLRIRQCDIKFETPITEHQRARITKRRIEQLLAKHFSKFDSVQGTVKLKNLEIDLGSIPEHQFDFQFFKRLENACIEIVEKIEVEREDTKASDKKSTDGPTAKAALNKDTSNESPGSHPRDASAIEIERVLSLLDTLKIAPNAESADELIKMYRRLYAENLSAESKSKLLELINEIQGRSATETTNKGASISESLKVIHDLLDKTNLDSHWFSNITQAYKNHFGHEMPEGLKEILRTTQELQKNTAESSLEANQKSKEKINTEAKLKDQFNEEFKGQTSEEELDRLSMLLDQFGGTVPINWIDKIERLYFEMYKTNLSKESRQFLTDFMKSRVEQKPAFSSLQTDLSTYIKSRVDSSEFERISTLISELDDIQPENWIDAIERSYFETYKTNLSKESRQFLTDFMKSRVEQKPAFSSLQTDLSTYIKSLVDSSEFERINTLILGLDNIQPENWLDAIERSYFETYKTNLSKESRQFLTDFMKSRVEQKSAVSSMRTDLSTYIKSRVDSSEFERINTLISELDGIQPENWIDAIERSYFETYKTNLSKESRQFLTDFMKPRAEQKPAVSSLQTDLSTYIKSHVDSSEFERINRIISELKGIKPENWVSAIERTYSALYQSKLTAVSLQSLKAFMSNYLSSTQDKNALRDRLSEYVKLHVTNFEFRRIKSILDQLDLENSKNWIGTIEGEYLISFQSELPKESRELLIKFMSSNDEFQQIKTKKTEDRFQVLDQLNSYLKSSKQTDVVVKLRSIIKEVDKRTSNNWFDELLKLYKSKFQSSRQFEVQNILLNFSKTIPAQKNSNRDELEPDLDSISLSDLGLPSNDAILNYLIGQLDEVDFKTDWIRELSKRFKSHFGTAIPQSLYGVLLDFEKRFKSTSYQNFEREDSNALRTQKAIFNKLKGYLSALKLNKVTSNLLLLVDELKDESVNDWFAVFSKSYAERFGKESVLEAQEILLNFSELEVGQASNDGSDKVFGNFKTYLEKRLSTIKSKEESQLIESNQRENEKIFDFFKMVFEAHLYDASWVKRSLRLFRTMFRKDMPDKLELLIRDLSLNWIKRNEFINGKRYDSAYVQLKRAVLRLNDSENKTELLDLIEELNESLSEKWFQEIVALYQSNFVLKIPSALQSILLNLDGQITAPLRVELPTNELISVAKKIENYYSVSDTIESENETVSESERIRFVLDQLKKTRFTPSWLEALLKAYKKHFLESMPQSIRNEITESLLKIESIELASEVEAGIDSKQLSSELKSALDAHLLSESDEVSNDLVSIIKKDTPEIHQGIEQESHKESQREELLKKSISERLIEFLGTQPKSREIDDLILISEELNENARDNWFKDLMQIYQERFKQKMPFAAQSVMLKFASTLKSEAIESLSSVKKEKIVDEFRKHFEAMPAEAIAKKSPSTAEEKSNNSDKEALNYILKLLDEIEFNFSWFDNILKAYKTYFGTAIPESIQNLLLDVGSKSTLNILENETSDEEKTLIFRLESYLNSLDKTPELEQLLDLLDSIKYQLEDDWREVILSLYSEEYGASMPIGLQSVLLKFSKQDVELSKSNSTDDVLDDLKNSIRSKMQSESNAKGSDSNLVLIDPTKDEVLYYLFKAMEEIEISSTWDNAVLEAFRNRHQLELPKELIGYLNKAFQSLNRLNKVKFEVRAIQLKTFLYGLNESKDVIVLMQLIDGIPQMDAKDWFKALMTAYRDKFTTRMPVSSQSVLLNFAKLLTEKPKTKNSSPLEFIKAELASIEQSKRDAVWLEEVEEAFEKQFDTKLSEGVKAILKERTITDNDEDQLAETIKALDDYFDALPQETDTVPLIVKSNEKAKKATDKAKILQLKVALKRFKNRDTDQKEEIIFDSGIILGWVLWKNVFTGFGWIEEGKFFTKEGINTGLLAVNWLSRLDGMQTDEVSLFARAICNLKVDEIEFYTNKEMNAFMQPNTLEDSIESYYTDLMLIWPIFELDQKAEFFEFFIHREGVISPSARGWRVDVVKQPFDALMIKTPLPWPLSYIQFPWTNNTIEVEW
ncbi:MAG: hypothetical protein ACJA1C_001863 [Crocinitomicaceae bacterium]|jgi:hypothetical protein